MRPPSNIVASSQYTIGNEFVLISSKTDYQGYYYEFNGKYYTGKTFNISAPEIIKKEKYSFLIDIWSFGCILYELVTGEVCFKGTACGDLSPIDKETIPLDIKDGMMDLIHNNEASKNLALICRMKNYDTELVELFKQCTEVEPSKRITSIDAINHKFFRN